MRYEKLISEIAKGLGVGGFDEVEYLVREKLTADAKDVIVFRIARERWILLISTELSPLMVKRGTDLRRRAHSLLHGSAKEAIDPPLLEGFYGKCSYALWRMSHPISSNRLLSKLHIIMLKPKVYAWLRDVTAQTAGRGDAKTMAENIARLASIRALPESVKAATEEALMTVNSGIVPAKQQLQHGDLSIGNILMAPNSLGFTVIDWPGAKIPDGMPFLDLLTFSASVQARPATLLREINAHCALLGCKSGHAMTYLLASLGRLQKELEYFPESRFVEFCVRNISLLYSATHTSSSF